MSDDPPKDQSSEYYDAYSEAIKHMAKPENYLAIYEQYFAKYTDKQINVLELGIFEGHSFDYFS